MVWLTLFALQFVADFVLSLVDIIATSQPRRIDAIFDGIAGLGYLAIFIASLVLSAIRGYPITSEASIVAR